MVKKADTKVLIDQSLASTSQETPVIFFPVSNWTVQRGACRQARPEGHPNHLNNRVPPFWFREQWKKLEEKEKQKYVDLYSKNKEQYEKDKKAYEEKHGKIERKSKKNKKAKAAKKGKEESEEEDEDDEEWSPCHHN